LLLEIVAEHRSQRRIDLEQPRVEHRSGLFGRGLDQREGFFDVSYF